MKIGKSSIGQIYCRYFV